MSIFKIVKDLKGCEKYEEAWNEGFVVLEEDFSNIFLKTSLFWVAYASLKKILTPIYARANKKPLPAEQHKIDLWIERILELNLELPNDNIDFRFWNLFTKDKIGKFCKPLCEFIAMNFNLLFRRDDFEPYTTQKGEFPSLVFRLAHIVSQNFIESNDKSNVENVMNFIDFSINNIKDKTSTIWLYFDKGKLFTSINRHLDARKYFLRVLDAKMSESWAWFSIASTYYDTPENARQLISYGLSCANDDKFTVKGWYNFIKMSVALEDFENASKALITLTDIYHENNWPIPEEVNKLLSSSWYDAFVDVKDLKGNIQTFASHANDCILVDPTSYVGIVSSIHMSGKGANIYISPNMTISAKKTLFKDRSLFNVGKFVEALCDKRDSGYIVISVKEASDFNKKYMQEYCGQLRKHDKGYGFVGNVFIQAFLIKNLNSGDSVSGLAVLKYDKVKNINSFSAINCKIES